MTIARMKHFMKEYGEWIFRIILLLAVGAQLYLTRNFVTREEYQEDQKQNTQQHLALQTTINDIASTVKIMAATQLTISDHETRLRVIEQKQADVSARLSAVEREQSRP